MLPVFSSINVNTIKLSSKKGSRNTICTLAVHMNMR